MIIREIFVGIFLAVLMVSLPWWATLAFACLALFITRGYGALTVGIVLDVIYLPATFPYGSIFLLIICIGTYYLQREIFVHDTITT